MNISPSELWEMDGEELIFWLERLKEISDIEQQAVEKAQ